MTSAEPGKWRTDRTPYLRGVMDAFTDPMVEEITLMFPTQVGKALDIETPIPTPEGWKLMREIKVGDQIFDNNGNISNVIAVSPITENRLCFKIIFGDGSYIIADANHKWYVERNCLHEGKPKVLTTEELRHDLHSTLKSGKQRNRWAIPLTKPLNLPEKNFSIDPYLFGYWLGDGHSYSGNITVGDQDLKDIIKILNFIGFKVKKQWDRTAWTLKVQKNSNNDILLYTKLSNLNVLKNKHIPINYLRSSYSQRLSLMQGLMDSDGYVSKKGYCEFSTKYKHLANEFYELAISLGLKPKIKPKLVKIDECRKKLYYLVKFLSYSNTPVFRLKRKLNRLRKKDDLKSRPTETTRRFIVSIEPCKSVPVKCIGIDSPTHLYLAGKAMIPTHNTESGLNILGYIVDQDPSPTLWVTARETDARSFSSDRIQGMIKISPILRPHKTTLDDDFTKMEMKFNRMILYMTGSNSPAALSSKPIRYLFLDETDKYPSFSGKEADPIKLATERTRTFWNRKIVKMSTPTTREGYIFREFEKSDRCRYYVPCPHCGTYQILLFNPNVKWLETERDPRRIRELKLAWYECSECKGKITDVMKIRMIMQGKWVPEGCNIDKSGKVSGTPPESIRKGFWMNALYSPWLTFSDIAAEFLSSKDEPALLMNFVNSWLAEVWEEKTKDTNIEIIKARCEDYEEGEIHPKTVVLTAGVDVQKDYFIVDIRGWAAYEESWLIRAVRLESWNEVAVVLFRTDYACPDGDKMSVRLACIDTGYRTDEVYEFCRSWSEVARAIKGNDHLSGVPYKVSKIDKHPRTGVAVPGGIALWHIDTTYYKDKVARLITAGHDAPGQWHIYKNVSEDYINQVCGEHKIIIRDRKSGRAVEAWRSKRKGENHYWDAEIYAAAAADMLRVSTIRPEDGRILFKAVKKQKKDSERSGSAWLGERGRGRWLK